MTMLVFASGSAQAFTLIASGIQGWTASTLTIKWNSSGCGVDATEFESELRVAIDAWNSVPTSRLKLAYGGTTATTLTALRNKTATDAPVIACNTTFLTDHPSDSGVVGLGFAQYLNGTGPVIDFGYIELNAQSGDSGAVSRLVEHQLALLLTHELGHVLGLGHSGDAASVMSYSRRYSGNTLLSRDDMDGISFLYPRVEPGAGIFGCGTLRTRSPSDGELDLAWVFLLELLVLVTLVKASKWGLAYCLEPRASMASRRSESM